MTNLSESQQTALQRIVAVLYWHSDEEIVDYCQKSSQDFFLLMQSRGVDLELSHNLIVDQFRIQPHELSTPSGFSLLREALYRMSLIAS